VRRVVGLEAHDQGLSIFWEKKKGTANNVKKVGGKGERKSPIPENRSQTKKYLCRKEKMDEKTVSEGGKKNRKQTKTRTKHHETVFPVCRNKAQFQGAKLNGGKGGFGWSWVFFLGGGGCGKKGRIGERKVPARPWNPGGRKFIILRKEGNNKKKVPHLQGEKQSFPGIGGKKKKTGAHQGGNRTETLSGGRGGSGGGRKREGKMGGPGSP